MMENIIPYFETKLGKIYHGDTQSLIESIPDNSIDLIVTSPPYNMRNRVRNGEYREREWAEGFSKKYQHFHDYLPIDIFYEHHKNVIQNMLRISKIIAYNIQIVTGSKEAFFQIIGDFRKYIKDIIIWDKGWGQPSMAERVLNQSYEMIIIFESDKKPGRQITNAYFERGLEPNIFRFNSKGKKDISSLHSASFPVELPLKLIEMFSPEKGVVFDPFLGSGTTAIACEKLKRKWVGFEISKEYCHLAAERIAEDRREILIYGD